MAGKTPPEKTDPTKPEYPPQSDPSLMRQQTIQRQLQQTNSRIMELKQMLEATISQADRLTGALGEIAYQQEQKG